MTQSQRTREVDGSKIFSPFFCQTNYRSNIHHKCLDAAVRLQTVDQDWQLYAAMRYCC